DRTYGYSDHPREGAPFPTPPPEAHPQVLIIAQRGERAAAKERARERERQRRRVCDGQESSAEAFGIKIPPPAKPGDPAQRPDFTDVDWDALGRAYPRDVQRVKRAMYIAFVGDRAKQAHAFMEWGLRPNVPHPESRFARDNASVELEGEPNLVSSTALYPTMNASEHLVAAAEVMALALTKGQARTSAVAALCRIAMESSAKAIWLISDTDTDERLRRCYGFIRAERGWQCRFDQLEAEALSVRTDALADAQRVQSERRRERLERRQSLIEGLPDGALKNPPGPLDIVSDAAGWMDAHLPRKADPELDRVIHPLSATSFYSLGSGFVHGFKWMSDYVRDRSHGELDDSGLLEVTLDAFGNAIRMTECAVSLFESQSIGPRADPKRVRNYPAGLAATVEQLAPRYL
ncbi:hypothetical protein, partial [Mycolicibacterium sp.]